uniref:Tyrosinase copper-binding domain-containing protein n=1 Tax=Corethron hystrix TaxID=216773 RepID=A0A6U5FS33_9STRA|mmetsp:Transcript_24146/g.54865  ORF Transcript_24146/g.54865 Transcript_24146/m.54865 type:complete len:1068 (+) Transcript_24146:132-3335(+)
MRIFTPSITFLWACQAMILDKVASQENTDVSYFDRMHEIYNPRIVPGSINDEDKYIDIEIKYEGYYAAKTVTLELFNDSMKKAKDIKPKSAIILSGPDAQEEKLQITKGKKVKKAQLLTKKDAGISETIPLTSFVMKFRFKKTSLFFPCLHTKIRMNIRVDRFNAAGQAAWVPLPSLLWWRWCRPCYSYAGIKMANHGQTLSNCGGRSCKCRHGYLTCNAKCKKRKAWHRLSHSSKIEYIDAINWLETQTNTPLGNHIGTTNARSYWNLLSNHLTDSNAHWNSKFLPWHRLYLCDFEQMLQLYNVCLTIPYWYHPIDSTKSQYHVLDDSYLGDNVHPYGLLNDPWDLPPSFAPFLRGGSNSNSALADVTDISNLLSSPDYTTYRNAAEGSTHHYRPHVEIGGNMGVAQSPADPFFWLHHCMVDRNWHVWRNMSPANAADYDGSLLSLISPTWNVTASDVINETGIMEPIETIYKGINQLPEGDHCAPCYYHPWFFIKWPSLTEKFSIHEKAFEAVLAEKFTPEELHVRSEDDSMVIDTAKANNIEVESLVKLARDGCNFRLPEEALTVIEDFNADPKKIKSEFCERILRPVASKSTILTTSIGPFNEKLPECKVDEVSELIELGVLIPEDILLERLLDECIDDSPKPTPVTPPTRAPSPGRPTSKELELFYAKEVFQSKSSTCHTYQMSEYSKNYQTTHTNCLSCYTEWGHHALQWKGYVHNTGTGGSYDPWQADSLNPPVIQNYPQNVECSAKGTLNTLEAASSFIYKDAAGSYVDPNGNWMCVTEPDSTNGAIIAALSMYHWKTPTYLDVHNYMNTSWGSVYCVTGVIEEVTLCTNTSNPPHVDCGWDSVDWTTGVGSVNTCAGMVALDSMKVGCFRDIPLYGFESHSPINGVDWINLYGLHPSYNIDTDLVFDPPVETSPNALEKMKEMATKTKEKMIFVNREATGIKIISAKDHVRTKDCEWVKLLNDKYELYKFASSQSGISNGNLRCFIAHKRNKKSECEFLIKFWDTDRKIWVPSDYTEEDVFHGRDFCSTDEMGIKTWEEATKQLLGYYSEGLCGCGRE